MVRTAVCVEYFKFTFNLMLGTIKVQLFRPTLFKSKVVELLGSITHFLRILIHIIVTVKVQSKMTKVLVGITSVERKTFEVKYTSHKLLTSFI